LNRHDDVECHVNLYGTPLFPIVDLSKINEESVEKES